jgi:hypothetical protein
MIDLYHHSHKSIYQEYVLIIWNGTHTVFSSWTVYSSRKEIHLIRKHNEIVEQYKIGEKGEEVQWREAGNRLT